MSGRERLSDQIGAGENIRPVLVSVGIGVITCILALLAMAAILSARSVPQMMIGPMAIFAVSVGAFASGFRCARIIRSRGLVLGATCGSVLTVLVLLASFALKDNTFGMPAVFKIVFIMLSAMLGGVAGVNTRKRRR